MATKGLSVARSGSLSDTEASSGRRVGAISHDDYGRLPHESEFLTQLGDSGARSPRVARHVATGARAPVRYVRALCAQIEAGKGNVSIVRLLRIALVFRCDEPAA